MSGRDYDESVYIINIDDISFCAEASLICDYIKAAVVCLLKPDEDSYHLAIGMFDEALKKIQEEK